MVNRFLLKSVDLDRMPMEVAMAVEGPCAVDVVVLTPVPVVKVEATIRRMEVGVVSYLEGEEAA